MLLSMNMRFSAATILLIGSQLVVAAASACSDNDCLRAVVGKSMNIRLIMYLASMSNVDFISFGFHYQARFCRLLISLPHNRHTSNFVGMYLSH